MTEVVKLTKLQAAEEVAKLRRLFAGLFAIEEELFTVGSLEQAASEAAAKLSFAQESVRLCEDDVARAKADIDDLLPQIGLAKGAKVDVDHVLYAAKQRADELVAGAEAHAAQTLAAMEADKARLQSEIDALSLSAQNYNQLVIGLQGQASAISAEIAVLETTRDSVTAAIQALKDKL